MRFHPKLVCYKSRPLGRSNVKCYRVAWKRKECHLYLFELLRIYEEGRTNVRTSGGVTNDFYVSMGLHQGSALSPFLFILVMDELTKGIQDELPWCMLFVDDLFLLMRPGRE